MAWRGTALVPSVAIVLYYSETLSFWFLSCLVFQGSGTECKNAGNFRDYLAQPSLIPLDKLRSEEGC